MVISEGLCECGCGRPAPIATKTRCELGHVRGKPVRFIVGHATKGKSIQRRDGQPWEGRLGQTNSPEHRRRISEAQRGEQGPNWRGGRILRPGRKPGHSARWLVYVGREHPMADTYGYVYEHRFVMAEALGRPLHRSEVVHHRDLDPLNNALENLALLNASEHSRIHKLIKHGVAPPEAIRIVLG